MQAATESCHLLCALRREGRGKSSGKVGVGARGTKGLRRVCAAEQLQLGDFSTGTTSVYPASL